MSQPHAELPSPTPAWPRWIDRVEARFNPRPSDVPPGPPRGAMPWQLRSFMQDQVNFMSKLRAMYGSVVQFGAIGERFWLVSDPALIDEVWVKQADAMLKDRTTHSLRRMLGMGLLTSEGELWRRPDQVGHAQALEAVEAYRRGEFDVAGRFWEQLPGADAAYNHGNALARAGRLQEALDAYDEALAQAPGMEDAVANRRAVEAAMQRQSSSGGGEDPEDGSGGAGDDGQSGDANEPQDAGSDGEGEQQEHKQEQGEGQGQDQQSQDGGADGARDDGQEQPPEAADTDSQREADEALREQMQRALEQGGEEDGEAQAAAQAPADVSEREQREAAEAWLRRIPDDPGGLLRARFRLEHERRRREGAD